jgi:hypothetical protein
MFTEEEESREVEEVEEDPGEIDDSEPLDLEADDDDDEAEIALTDDDDDEEDEASLEELLAQRAASRRGADETDDDSDDIMALASEAGKIPLEPLPTKVIPVKDQQEFVCNRCHLVKARSQLADAKRGLCRDCV